MAAIFKETFKALLKEAQFTKEMLGSGATQIRKANYATKGVYFQAFTNLSTGLERIGKLCLMLDHYIETNGKFPDSKYFKRSDTTSCSFTRNRASLLNGGESP